MFWHEEENDINLIPFNKSNYLKLLNQQNFEKDVDDQKEKKQKIVDISDNFRIDMLVPTNWGPGKVVNIDDLTKKITIKIEGVEQIFDMFEIHPYLTILFHVFFKDQNLIDKKVILNENIFLDDKIGKIKKKISCIFQADETKVIILHKGQILADNNLKISECGLYEQESLLVVINGTCVY